MLEFFRKYQRYVFIFITIVIIASFSFFGTFSTLSDQREKREDRLLALAVDGSEMMLSQVQALSRFIASDQEDFDRSGSMPNLCNNGVVRYDLLRSGLADLLAASYFNSLKEEFATRLDRVKRFRPYAHPEMPFLSAESVWERFLPAMNREMNSLKQEPEASLSTFSHLSLLYQQQSYLTPESLRRILFFQQRQLGGTRADPRLQYEDLSLFGFHSLADWFSRDFIDLASEFILNAAQVAKAKGFHVTLEEAKGDLLCNFQTALQRQELAKSNPQITFHQHLRTLGFDENSAAEVWQKVLLFRRYFQGVSHAAFVDRLPYRDFASYARETALVSLYQWPAAFHLKNLQDLIEFQTYLQAVSPPLEDPLGLPSRYYSVEEIKERHPELVQVYFQAKVAEISLSETALRAAVKEVWEWQCEDQNWETMRHAFSFLPAASREERFRCLEKLTAPQRSQVDACARLRLLDRHPEWVEEAWTAASSREETIRMSSKAASLPHIEKIKEFTGLLARAADGQEEAKNALLRYSDDGKTLYRIEGVSCSMPEHVLIFEEAKQQGVLAGISDRNLQRKYLKVREKSPAKFKTEKEEWQTYAEAKAEVAKIAFSDVFKAIELQNKGEDWTDDLYASYRMLPLSKQAFEALKKDPLNAHWVQGNKTELKEQFQLVRKEHPIQRTDKEKWMKEKAFQMVPNDWSPIHVPPDGDISFFYLIEKKPSEAPILDQIAFGKELIAADAQRYLAEKLLETISQKQSIVIPLQSEP